MAVSFEYLGTGTVVTAAILEDWAPAGTWNVPLHGDSSGAVPRRGMANSARPARGPGA